MTTPQSFAIGGHTLLPIVQGGMGVGISAYQLELGASAMQPGTAFAVTEEGDAHTNFKHVLADAQPEDIVTFISVASLPARAVHPPWLANSIKREARLQAVAKADLKRCAIGLHCLTHCGLHDDLEKAGQFCIDSQRVAALKGNINKGLFSRGSEALPFGSEIRPLRGLIDYLMTGVKTAAMVEAA